MQKKDPNSEKGRQINTIKEAITALTSEADHKIATLTAEADKKSNKKKKRLCDKRIKSGSYAWLLNATTLSLSCFSVCEVTPTLKK